MLKTDFKDDILPEGGRCYTMRQNEDGTVSFTDVTAYVQEGDSVGAADINAVNQVANAAMPIAGGKFTGNVVANSTARTGSCLRNVVVRDSAGTYVSTNMLYLYRK